MEKVQVADFRERECPADTALLFVDPPYHMKKNYLGSIDEVPYHHWVHDTLHWNKAPWALLLGPTPTLREWLPLVPEPDYLLWWHRTFLLPGRKLKFFAPSITPILVYRREGAPWYGPIRQERDFHDVIDAHSNMGDITRLRSLGLKLPKHPALTGTSLPKKIIPLLTREKDLVVDPMAGCGSILVAAQRLGRWVWGCEISSEYAGAANAWLELERLRR